MLGLMASNWYANVVVIYIRIIICHIDGADSRATDQRKS